MSEVESVQIQQIERVENWTASSEVQSSENTVTLSHLSKQARRRSRHSLPSTQRDECAIPRNFCRNFFGGKLVRNDRQKYMQVSGNRRVLARIESLDDRTAAALKLVWPGPSKAGGIQIGCARSGAGINERKASPLQGYCLGRLRPGSLIQASTRVESVGM